MLKNIEDYVKVYEGFLDESLCDATVENLKSIHFKQHEFYNVLTDSHISYEKELSISHGNIPEKRIIQDKLWFAIRKYLDEFNFKWYNGWAGYSEIRFNRYDVNTQMKLHCDHIHSMFDGERKGIPVLSLLGILNDDYKGGEFIMFQDKKIELKKGDLLIFPSIFLYPHRVEPVTKGTRYSFISWVW